MKQFLTILICATTCLTFAQKEKVTAYINVYKTIAIKEMQRTGVPASITLAQAILESQFGESDLSKKSNNHFGIKCKTEWTGEKVYHDDDEKQECFRKYNDIDQSFIDHSDFLKNRPYYAPLFKLDITDYEAWAKGLKQCGYATEHNYPELLIKLIKEHDLHQYTLVALANVSNIDSFIAVHKTPNTQLPKTSTTPTISNKTSDKITIATPTLTVIADEPEVEETKPIVNTIEATKANYPQGIFLINNTKALYAQQGTSTLVIALDNNISLAKLFEYNDMQEAEFIETNKVIFIEKKQKKGNTDFYIVQSNETLHEISQKLGIQLQTLADFNNIHKKLNPLVGEKLFLKAKASTAPKAGLATNN